MQSPQTPADPLVIRVRNCGNIANFKNAKRSVGNRLITDPEMKARKIAIQRAIECALTSGFPIAEGGTSTAAPRPCSIHSLPHDDCWTCIPELILTAELVSDGSEGADITIERLP